VCVFKGIKSEQSSYESFNAIHESIVWDYGRFQTTEKDLVDTNDVEIYDITSGIHTLFNIISRYDIKPKVSINEQ